MSGGNDNSLPEGSPNQVVRNLRGRCVRLSNVANNVGGLSLSVNGESSSDGLGHSHSVQSQLVHTQSNSGGHAMPQASNSLDLELQSMFGSAHSQTLSHDLAFPSAAQPVASFSQQPGYPQSNNLFQMPTSLFPTHSRGRVFHGYTFRDLKIEFGTSKPVDPRQVEMRVLRALEALMRNPPALPENTVEELQPKQIFPDYIKLPDDASKAEHQVAEKINNEIAAESQKVDRERNNEAAKRSRRLKNENLDNANRILVKNALRIAWLEAQLCAMGGRPEAFDTIDPSIKQRIHGKIVESRESFYEQRKKNKSKKESKKRSDHNKKRALQKRELNERAARQCAEADQVHGLEAILDTASPASLDEIVVFSDHRPVSSLHGQNHVQLADTNNPSFINNGVLDGSFMLMASYDAKLGHYRYAG